MECGPFVPNLLTGLEMYLLGPCRRGQDVVLEVQPVTNGKLQRFFSCTSLLYFVYATRAEPRTVRVSSVS